jgi:branched-subunit amino acid aminotransferase/4-amino-4-deoxychorismate lyase
MHLERLRASLRFVGIAVDMPDADLAGLTRHVVALNEALTSAHPVCRVGHWVTRGIEEWVPLDERKGGVTICIVVQPVGRTLSPEEYRSGVPLSIVSTRRSPPSVLDPRVKTTSRLNPIVAELEGSTRGALALMLDVHGYVAEGPTFNFFLVRDGRLLTPRAEHVLPGITRRTVLELATELGIPAGEVDLSPYEIASASEFFVTASTWGVLPVRSVDRFIPRDGVPGEVSMTMIDRMAKLTGYHPLEPHRVRRG